MRAVVKFGGSLITHKGIENYPKTAHDIDLNPSSYLQLHNIQKIGNITDHAKIRDKNLELVLVTGAGCCGHPQVKANFPAKRINGIASMPATYLAKALWLRNIEVKQESPMFSAKCLESDGKHGINYNISELWEHLSSKKLDYVAISHGDIVPMAEGKTGRLGNYEVISGDDLITYFGTVWPADRVINVSNVDGIYAEFPPEEGQKPITNILADEKLRDNAHFKGKMETTYQVKFSDVKDVTGGLFAKVRKLYDFTQSTGIISQIVGLDKLEHALQGMYVGTVISKS